VRKIAGGAGACRSDVLQQICPVQSLLTWHDFGHVFEQMPLQQSGFVASQSEDTLHVFGQASPPRYVGLRHRPAAARSGSSAPTDVQQMSPALVLQSLLALHAFGHSLAGRQIPCL
jgi:hypothetical protein